LCEKIVLKIIVLIEKIAYGYLLITWIIWNN